MKSAKYTLIALLLVLATVLSLGLTACSSQAPALDDVRARFEEAIEDSYEINEILFGEGLPTHARDGEFAIENFIYYGFYGYDAYEYVTEDSPYRYVEEIRDAAARVYSADYLEEISTMAFVGYADDVTGAVTTARYQEVDGILLRYSFGDNDPFNLLPGKRRYLMDTMEIVKPSSATSVNVKIDSYLLGEEDEILSVTLRFVLENDEWYLDTPTY